MHEGGVLIVDGDAQRRGAVCSACAAKTLPVLEVPDAFEAMAALGRSDFRAIVVAAGKRHLSLRGLCQLARRRHPDIRLFILLRSDTDVAVLREAIGVDVQALDGALSPDDIAARVAAGIGHDDGPLPELELDLTVAPAPLELPVAEPPEPRIQVDTPITDEIELDGLAPPPIPPPAVADAPPAAAVSPRGVSTPSVAPRPGPAPTSSLGFTEPAPDDAPPSPLDTLSPRGVPTPSVARRPGPAPTSSLGFTEPAPDDAPPSPLDTPPAPFGPRPITGLVAVADVMQPPPAEPPSLDLDAPTLDLSAQALALETPAPSLDLDAPTLDLSAQALALETPAPSLELDNDDDEADPVDLDAPTLDLNALELGAAAAEPEAGAPLSLPAPAPVAAEALESAPIAPAPAAVEPAPLAPAPGSAEDLELTPIEPAPPAAELLEVPTAAPEPPAAEVEPPAAEVEPPAAEVAPPAPSAPVPSAPAPSASAPTPGDEMLLEGSLEEGGGAALLMALFAQELSGRLLLTAGGATTTLFIFDGEPVWAEIPGGDAAIYERLVQRRLLAPDAPIAPVPNGQLLHSLGRTGVLTQAQVQDFMRGVVRDSILDLAARSDGSYRFVEDPAFRNATPLFRLNPFGLILESRRKGMTPDRLLAIAHEMQGHYLIPGPGLAHASRKIAPFVRDIDLSTLITGEMTVGEFSGETGLDIMMGTLVMIALDDARLVRIAEQSLSQTAAARAVPASIDLGS